MIRRHVRFSSVKQRGTTKNWTNKLEGSPCFIIGNAPSLNDEDISPLADYFTIGINRAFIKIDPTILMWQDIELWYTERKNITKLSSIKVCRDVADPQNRFHHFRLEHGDFKIPNNLNVLHGTGATGPLAVQYAYILGCNPIVLVGMDCKYRDKQTNFYGKNRYHRPHTLINCNKGLKWIKKTISDRTIINCSDNNIWKERQELSDVLKNIDKKWKKNRSYYSSFFT